jgi:hypothetical protein
VTVSLTDAASLDLSMLWVDVTGVQLRKVTGEFVPVLAGPISVDLLSLSDQGRVLGLAAATAGQYTHVRLEFDLSQALAFAIGSAAPATLLDWDGNVLPTAPVAALVGVSPAGYQILGGKNRLLELEVDVDQSARVDAQTNTVYFEPRFVLRLDPADPAELLVAGRLERVKGNAVDIGLEDELGTPLQTVRVLVDQDTVYQIDGVPLAGAAGRAALAALPDGTSIQARGSIRPKHPSIDATSIEAGAGTHGGGQDIVQGHVISRSGSPSPVLTVYGTTSSAGQTVQASDVIATVHTDAGETRVVSPGSGVPLLLDDLNVGQRVQAFGTLSGTTLSADGPGGVLRLESTRVFGLALAPPSGGTLTLDLERVDSLFETSFQWHEGGSTPLSPLAMIASTGSLADGLGIDAGTPVELRGRFSPLAEGLFDYSATAAANLEAEPALFLLQNRPPAGAPGGVTVVVTPVAGGIELAFLGAFAANEFALIDRGYLGSTPFAAAAFQALGGTGSFLLHDRLTNQHAAFADFAGFAALLGFAAQGGAEVVFFGARGVFDEATSSMQVTQATADVM